jgi:hypothetical protein
LKLTLAKLQASSFASLNDYRIFGCTVLSRIPGNI